MARRPNRPARIRPYFVKVLYKRFSKKLMIPRKYVSLHGNTLGEECVLWPTHTRNSFRVRTKNIDNELYFKKGWDAFAKQHSLKFGDLLIFRHVQNSEFDVDVLDMSGTLREPVPDMTGTPREPVVSENDQLLREAARVPPPPSDNGREKNNIIENAALTAAEALILSSELPFFKKIMKAADLRPGAYLYVPAHYAKERIKESTKYVQIEFSDKLWIAKVQRRPSEYRTFITGWSDFARESNLQEGDVCVFQLISTKDNTLKLTIFQHASGENQRRKQYQVKSKSSHSELTMKSKEISKKAVEVKKSKEVSDNKALKSGKPSPSDEAREEAKKFQLISKHTCFLTVICTAYKHSYLHVPKTFVEKMRKKNENGSKVKLQSSHIELNAIMKTVRGQWRITAGWSTIARKESIEVGDVCVLELINREEDVIKISIFKCNS